MRGLVTRLAQKGPFVCAVHPEPEADGHREVRARARRDRGWWGGGASGLVPSGLGKQHLRGTHCLLCGGFLPRHEEDLREPLVRFQGSQVSMRAEIPAFPGEEY